MNHTNISEVYWQIDEIPGKVRQSAGNGKISCQNDEIICKARESVIVSGRDRAALIQEHAFKRTGAELHLEPFAFAEEQIIDVQAASVQRFKITLPFRQENIRAVQKLFRFRADSRKPGAAYVAPVSHYLCDGCHPGLFGVFQGGVVDGGESPDKDGDIQIRVLFFQDSDSQLIQNDLAAVVGDVYEFFRLMEFLKKTAVFFRIKRGPCSRNPEEKE